MDRFLKIYKFPKLTQEEIENFNRPITSKEIGSVNKTSQQREVLDQMVLLVNSPTFKNY